MFGRCRIDGYRRRVIERWRRELELVSAAQSGGCSSVRLFALSAVNRGMHPRDVALAFGACVSTVYGWIQARNEGGVEALKVTSPSGHRKFRDGEVCRSV
ncbi:helix-turn-helix domain-containing protein [Frankia sp. R82]|uniref:helix-turn-helix domain-containing protein n=1 Tax=Frankia sp. R82 TaxID=2950553 RepID=UPI0035ABE260